MMEHINKLLFVFAMLQIIMSSPVSSSSSSPRCKLATSMAKSINNFGFSLSGTLEKTGNVFVSPFGIYSAIVSAYFGAKGKTAKEIERVLQIDRKIARYPFWALTRSYLGNAGGDYNLQISNGLFLKSGTHVIYNFERHVEVIDHATVMHFNFTNASELAKKLINEWVAKRTHGGIKQIASDLDKSFKIMVVNTIYFKGFWKTQFDKKLTHDATFHKKDGKTKQVKMMKIDSSTKSSFHFHEDNKTGYKYLELPYKGDNIVMLLALPRSAENFQDKPMNSSQLCMVFSELKGSGKTSVTIEIPRFKLEYKKEMKDSLVAVGIRDLFNGSSANLAGISKIDNLSVSSILHKAVIDVSEEGSESYPETDVKFSGRSVQTDHFEFLAHHPFFFYIVDKRNGLVLFLGRVTDP